LSKHPSGNHLSFGHTVLERPDTDEIAWDGSISVGARSLGSLVEMSEIPQRVGLVKIDTEGHDFAVVNGLGALECDVIMLEHWVDLPLSLGPCPWTADDMVRVAAAHGFSQFAFLHHSGELTILQWDDATVPVGSMGNLFFIHDRVRDRLLPTLLAFASDLGMRVLEVADSRATVAAERLP